MKKYSLKLMGLTALTVALGTVGCKKKEIIVDLTPTTLECDYFRENRTLEHDPDKSVDYVVECDMIVDGDITVMPGTVIEFKTDAGIKVRESGSFNAEGTTDQPIVFRGTEEVAGSWRGIFIDSNDPKNQFKYCSVMHAGGVAHNSNGDRGSFVLWADSKVAIENSSITAGDADGINAIYGGADITLANNTISGHSKAALRIDPTYLGVPNASDTYQGNTENYIVVRPYSHDISENLTWKKVDVDYKVSGGTQTIPIDADVTIEPGVNIYFDAGCAIRVRDGASLNAVGTSTDKITFRGLNPVAGAWGGIYFNSTTNTLNKISYAEISHAGNPDFDGAIYMWASPVVTVTYVAFSNLGSCAMFAGGAAIGNPNLTQNNNTFVNVPQELCED